MPLESQPFNGNYIGADGQLHNLDGATGEAPSGLGASMMPFNGIFINSEGMPQGLETVLTGGGSSGSDLNLPEGGVDGQMLVKEGKSLVWGDVASPEDVASIQNTVGNLMTDNTPEGATNKYFQAAQVDQSIETNESVMIKASYAINGASGKVDASVKADKMSSVKSVSLYGDVSGTGVAVAHSPSTSSNANIMIKAACLI